MKQDMCKFALLLAVFAAGVAGLTPGKHEALSAVASAVPSPTPLAFHRSDADIDEHDEPTPVPPEDAAASAQSKKGKGSRSEVRTPMVTTLKKPPKPWFSQAMWVMLVFAPGAAVVSLLAVLWMRRLESHQAVNDMEVVERSPDNLDEDVYGAGIATLVRDCTSLVDGKGDMALRMSRLCCSFFLMIFVIFLQIFVILQMQQLVAARAVMVIRQIYDVFEFVMYGEDESHTYLTVNGFHRGLDKKYFMPENFDLLTMAEKESTCSIPFSQLQLLIPILFIWSLCIISDLRRCGDLFVRLILSTPTISSMKDSTVPGEGEEVVVVGLTREVKSLLMMTTIIPRYLINCYLLWIGCRWLAATPSFTDLLLNSVALEFVVLLKDALYVGVTPDRNKRTTQNTLIQPWQKVEPANYRIFLSAFLLIGAAFGWVCFFIFRFQAVLPDYKWDVHDVCTEYIKLSTSGTSAANNLVE